MCLSVPSDATDTISNPRVERDATGDNLTISGLNPAGKQISAVVPAINDRRVQLRGQDGALSLLKINYEDLTFTEVNPTSSTSTAEGEQANSVAAATSSLMLGEMAAEGESLASGSGDASRSLCSNDG